MGEDDVGVRGLDRPAPRAEHRKGIVGYGFGSTSHPSQPANQP